VAVPVATAWLVVSLRLGRQAQALQDELKPNAP